jgi:hypothetical protein
MSAWIAVTDLLVPSELKKYALFFDAFTDPFSQAYTSTITKVDEQSQAEITWLYENGIVVFFSHEIDLALEFIRRSSVLNLPEGTDVKSLFAVFNEWAEKIETGETPEKVLSGVTNEIANNVYALLKGMTTIVGDVARLMAGVLRDTQKLNAYPLLHESLVKIFPSEPKKGRHDEDVLSVILKRLPEPDNSVPWEQIIEYRTDPASKGKLLALRNWTHEMVRSELTQQEIEDK